MACDRLQFVSTLVAQLAAVGCKIRSIDRAVERVELTVDRDAQALGKRVLREHLQRLLRQIPDFDGGLVTVRNNDSAVLVYIGSLRADRQFDNCRSGRRDLGSTCKPFIYASALQTGAMSEDERFADIPLSFRRLDGNGNYTVRNYAGRYTGRDLDIFEALARSSNVVAMQVYQRVGPEVMRRTFKQLQLGSDFNVNLLPAGRWSAPLAKVAAAYAVFPNEGIFHPVRFVSLSRPEPDESVFRTEVCRTVSAAMALCLTNGTGASAADLADTCRGKTGSASGVTAVLGTKAITTVIWLGHTNSNRDLGLTGGGLAMPAVAAFYRELRKIRSEWFPAWPN